VPKNSTVLYELRALNMFDISLEIWNVMPRQKDNVASRHDGYVVHYEICYVKADCIVIHPFVRIEIELGLVAKLSLIMYNIAGNMMIQ